MNKDTFILCSEFKVQINNDKYVVHLREGEGQIVFQTTSSISHIWSNVCMKVGQGKIPSSGKIPFLYTM
jgi:hypothetical protein